MPVTHDVCARTGTYQDSEGNEKTRWKNVGVKIVTDKGEFVKLDCYPLPNIEGEVWLTLFPKKEKPAQQGFRGKAAPF